MGEIAQPSGEIRFRHHTLNLTAESVISYEPPFFIPLHFTGL